MKVILPIVFVVVIAATALKIDWNPYFLVVILLLSMAFIDSRRTSLIQHQLYIIRRQQKGEDILSPEVKLMAKDPTKKYAAIKLHRDQNPKMTIANAKWDIENLS